MIFTGLAVTGGSCLCTIFLEQSFSHTGYVATARRKTANSIRSPFRIMVSGFATFPLMVVTPDSRAYLWTGTVGVGRGDNLDKKEKRQRAHIVVN